jgi:hypothetical protein
MSLSDFWSGKRLIRQAGGRAHNAGPRDAKGQRGTLFPHVVSDFSLIDAIESGIVKVPRVPVTDDQMRGEQGIACRELLLRVGPESQPM